MEETNKEDQKQAVLPFDNLYLNSGYVSGFNDWWMYAIAIMFTVLCYLCAPVVTSLHLLIMAQQNGITLEELSKDPNQLFNYRVIGVDRNLILLAMLGIFVITMMGFYTAIRKIHRKTLLSILTGYEKFRFKRFWFAFMIWGGILLISVLVSYFFGLEDLVIDFNLRGFVISFFMMLLLMPIQTGFEELFFRGYLVQGLSQIFKNGIVPVIITSILFGLAHISNPEVKEYGWVLMLSYYTLFGLFLGCVALLDEGLELAFGIHFAHNFISSLMVNSKGSVLKTYSVFESGAENPAAELLLWFGMAFITFVIFWSKYRWKNFRLIIK
ncbi:MAG TPA: CPBP family intramembrane metalloprotease [Bacteroidia bacterium]|nr:CPBP family intramembrane metalloprotease [Bacteroidia bacterium]